MLAGTSSTRLDTTIRIALYCAKAHRPRKAYRRLFLTSAKASSQAPAEPATTWTKSVIGGLAISGAIQGPLLDGIHGTVHLLDYKVARVDVGGLHTSLWVPVLLGSYYLVVGVLFNLADTLALSRESTSNSLLDSLGRLLSSGVNPLATQQASTMQSWPRQALNVGAVALLLYLSAVLYQNSIPYIQIWAVLAVCGLSAWKVFDNTKQGFLLSLLCAVAAPLSELVIINALGLWQYPHPDIFGSGGVPSWVACCYFFYTPAVGNLARLLKKRS